jgi:hypothetical protein
MFKGGILMLIGGAEEDGMTTKGLVRVITGAKRKTNERVESRERERVVVAKSEEKWKVILN